MPDVKEYLLLTSDERAPYSKSTTDFTIELPVPLTNVVKTDLVQVSMDYNVANIREGASPGADNSFNIGLGNVSKTTKIIFEEGLYTVDVLATWLETQLNSKATPFAGKWTVYYGITSKLMIEFVLPTSTDDITNRQITCSSGTLSYTLGLSNTTAAATPLSPVLSSSDGRYGTYRWYFPYPVQLNGIFPYLYLQSRTLGTDMRTAKNTVGFYRMILNDPVNYQVSMVNNRVDTYQRTPTVLQNIDFRVLYPDGTVVNNNGGRFSVLLEIIRRI